MIFQYESGYYFGIIYGNLEAIKKVDAGLLPETAESRIYLDLNIVIKKDRTYIGLSQ